MGDAGALLTRVVFVKEQAGKRFVIVDAAMTELIRPALYGAFHAIMPVDEALANGTLSPADLVGPVCESGDFLAQDRPLPAVNRGDLLAVMSAGAYGFTMASNYNDRRRPPEVLVDGDRYAVVRKRESYRDLLRLDQPRAPKKRVRAKAGAAR